MEEIPMLDLYYSPTPDGHCITAWVVR